MTKRQQRSIMRYVHEVAPLLGIGRGWVFVVHRDPPANPDCIGHCACVFGQRVAHLRFSAEFLDCPPEDQRETILHELLHVVHAVTQDQVQHVLANHMPKEAHAVFADLFNHAHEYAVDSLAVAIAPLFPMPELG